MNSRFAYMNNVIKFSFNIGSDEGLESYLFRSSNKELVLITNTSQKNGFKENIKEYLLEYVLFKLSQKCDSVKTFKELYPVLIQHLIYFGLIKINNLTSILMESKNQRCLYCLKKFTNVNMGKTFNRDIFCDSKHKNDFKNTRKKFFKNLLGLSPSSSLTVEEIEVRVNGYLEGLLKIELGGISAKKPIQGEISDWFEYLYKKHFVEKTEEMILEKIKLKPTILENDDINSDLLDILSKDIYSHSLAASKPGSPKKRNLAISSNKEEAFNSLRRFLNLQFSYQKLKVEQTLFLDLDHFVIRRPIGSLCLKFHQHITQNI